MEAVGMVEPLRQGKTDTLFLMDWNDGDFVAQGVPLRHLRSKLLERIRVSSCYWATETNLARNEETLSRALRAIQKSLVFSFANPEAALKLMWQVFPETEPPGASDREASKRQLEILKACLEPMRIDEKDPDPRWCAIPHQEMLAWQDFLRHPGTKGAEVDVARCYTTTLVDRINDFTSEPIASAALVAS
jgi:NitT/TauT family transport system substrate-binding protein